MNKANTKKYVLSALLALMLGVAGTGISTAVRADAAESAPAAGGEAAQITPLLETSFDDGTAGEKYKVDDHVSAIWDQNYNDGSIADTFDGKAYRFKIPANASTVDVGGIKVQGAVDGESYTLTMKADFADCDFIFVEYVADNNALGNTRWGGFKLYHDRIDTLEANNSFADYNAETKELSFTFTAGTKVWSETVSEPGFVKFTSSNSGENAYLDIDDVKITVAGSLMDENCERFPVGALDRAGAYNKFWNDASSLSVVEWGTDNKAVKFTSNADPSSTELSTIGYLNRLGFITNNSFYDVSFDFEMVNLEELWINYNGAADICVKNGTAVAQSWNGDKLQNVNFTVDPANPNKGTLSFRWKALENKSELKMLIKSDASASGDRALILDNIKVDAVRHPVTVEKTEGNGSFSALTFQPRTGTDSKIFVKPDKGWHVKSVEADGSPVELSADGSYLFENVTAPHTLTASFERDKINVTVDSAEGVTVTATENVLYGDSVTFTVTPEEHYVVTSVKLNGKTVELTDNKYIVESATEALNFVVLAQKISEYPLTFEATEGGGTVICSAEKVYQGESAVFTVTPNEGWQVKSVKYNGKNVALVDGKYTVENVTEDGKLVVEFAKIATEEPPVTGDSENPGTPEIPGDTNGGKKPVGLIVGIVCGVVGVGAIAAVTVVVVRKKKSAKSGKNEKDGENNE